MGLVIQIFLAIIAAVFVLANFEAVLKLTFYSALILGPFALAFAMGGQEYAAMLMAIVAVCFVIIPARAK